MHENPELQIRVTVSEFSSSNAQIMRNENCI